MIENNESNNNFFIARQPILDKSQVIFGYELFSRSSTEKEFSDIENNAENDALMFFNILSSFGLEHLLGNKRAFLNCTAESLASDFFDLLSPKGIVLEMNLTESDNIVDLISHVKELSSKGYEFASNEIIFNKQFSTLIPFIKYIKIINQKNRNEVSNLISLAYKLNKKIVIEKIETLEDFNFFKKLNVDYFQGYFFCKPTNLSTKINNPSVTNLIKLLNLTIKESPFKEIELILKTDPDLSFKLLKYINSAGMTNGQKIESFNHALQMLGYQKLFKWLSILFSTAQKDKIYDAIAQTAIIRSRFMELLAEECLGSEHQDNCFVTGMFSMLEPMLNVPMNVALNEISLPPSINNALLKKQGEYAGLLQMVIALEENNWIDLLAHAKLNNLSDETINKKYLESIEWTNKIKSNN